MTESEVENKARQSYLYFLNGHTWISCMCKLDAILICRLLSDCVYKTWNLIFKEKNFQSVKSHNQNLSNRRQVYRVGQEYPSYFGYALEFWENVKDNSNGIAFKWKKCPWEHG